MTNREKTDELLARLHTQVDTLTSGDDWKAALAWQAKFHRYSFSNTLLIAIQRPDATFVRGFKAWNELGRSVKKGEKGIGILAPNTYKKTDEATGEERTSVRGFRTAYVFDVEQTEDINDPTAPFVNPASVMSTVELDGDAPVELDLAIAKLIVDQGYRLERRELLGEMKGYTAPTEKLVVVKADASPLQAMKTAVHELAHIMLHVGQTEVDGEPFSYGSHRGLAEVEAESVAFIVCSALGLPTDDYSFTYVGGWSGGDMDLVKKSGTRAAKTATAILDSIDRPVVS